MSDIIRIPYQDRKTALNTPKKNTVNCFLRKRKKEGEEIALPHLTDNAIYEHLQKELPLLKTNRHTGEEYYTDATIAEIYSHHFDLGNLELQENKERVANIDTFIKVGLSQYLANYNEMMSNTLYGLSTYKVPSSLALTKLKQGGGSDPYAVGRYRKSDTMDGIQQLLGDEQYANICKRFHNKMTNHVTITEPERCDQTTYNKVQGIFREHFWVSVQIEIVEIIAKEFIAHIIEKNFNKIQKELSDHHKTLKKVRVYKCNKIVDVINGTDIVVSLEYVDNKGDYFSTDAALIDLKVKQDKTMLANTDDGPTTQIKKKLLTKEGHYGFFQSDRAVEIDREISSLLALCKQDMKQHLLEQKVLGTIDSIGSTIELLNHDVSYYSSKGDPDALIQRNEAMLEQLENTLLVENSEITPESVEQAFGVFKKSFDQLYEKAEVIMDLGINHAHQFHKELHLSRRTMTKLFDIAFASILEQGSIDFESKNSIRRIKAMMESNEDAIFTILKRA